MERFICNRCQQHKPESDFSELARHQARADSPDAMCLDCVAALYRSRMSMNEAYAFTKEQTDRQLEAGRLPGQEERKNKELRWGRALHHSDVISRLRNILPSLYVQEGNLPGDLSLYDIAHNQVRYLCYIPQGYLPEYSIVITDERNLPKKEQRGWRTVLLRLIKAGVITETQADVAFGEPTSGDQAKFYRQQLFDFRNQRYIHAQ